MSIQTACAACGAAVRAPRAAAGKTLKCPKCRSGVTVPGGEGVRPHGRTGKVPRGGTPLWVWAAVGAGVLLLLCLGGGVAALASWAAIRGLAANAPAATYTPMTADQLIDEWESNPAAAAEKYRRNGVEITGRLKEVNSNIHGQTYIDVRGDRGDKGGGWRRGTHIFVLSAQAKDGLAGCKVGDFVVVRARAEGSTHDSPWLIADQVSPK